MLLAAYNYVSVADDVVVKCITTKGPIAIVVRPEWAPLGAARFLELVRSKFYTNIGFYRCVDKFLTQFGITDNPTLKHWHSKPISDDPNLNLGIKRHYVSFAGGGPNTRTTQIFVAFEDLDFLGKEPWETPFGYVTAESSATLNGLYKGYGDMPPWGKGPEQEKVFNRGNTYLKENFPELDYLLECRVEEPVQSVQTIYDHSRRELTETTLSPQRIAEIEAELDRQEAEELALLEKGDFIDIDDGPRAEENSDGATKKPSAMLRGDGEALENFESGATDSREDSQNRVIYSAVVVVTVVLLALYALHRSREKSGGTKSM